MSENSENAGSKIDRLMQRGFYFGVGFILFSLGAAFYHFGWWPAKYYRYAFQAYEAQNEKKAMVKEAVSQKRIPPPQLTAQATTKLPLPARMQLGSTLVCGEQSNLFLINESGQLLYEWKVEYSKIWPKPSHVAAPVPEEAVNCVSSHAYPDGSVLIAYHAWGDTPYGYGLAKLDSSSNVVWTYNKNAHHDIYVAQDGTIYTLTQEFYKEPIEGLSGVTYPILGDSVSMLSPDGTELDTIPLIQAFIGTEFEAELQKAMQVKEKFDYIHTNSVMPLEPALAEAFPMFEVGDILISARNYDLIFVVSPKTKKVKWGLHGTWRGQHHARFLSSGHIMLFDNNGFKPEGRGQLSRLLEIDPVSGETRWTYIGKNDGMFYTDWNGSQEVLANGNVLITVSKPGRLLEVSRDKKLVWSYHQKLPIYSAHRYVPDYFDRDFMHSWQKR